MELLAGESLAERLARVGRLTIVEAQPIAIQLASALSAAHRAGVVHRDFKSRNAALVPSGEGALRAVVTDFGLARVFGARGRFSSLTGSAGLVGSSDYMAPEQVEGGEVTPAADIYALGVVLYEMVTGVLPFVGDSPLSTALMRLNRPAPSPRMQVPDLDVRWVEVIERCLEREPADRYATAEEVARALSGDPVEGVRPLANRPNRRRLFVASVAAATLTGSLGYFIATSRNGRPAPMGESRGNSTPKPRRAVALLGFKNLSGRPDTAWLSTALSETLSTELAAGGKLRTIPGEEVARMKMDLPLVDTDILAKDTLALVRKNLGTDVVVLGSYLALGKDAGGRIRLDLRIQDAVAGETIASAVEMGTEAELFDLVSRAGSRLRESLGVASLSGTARPNLAGSLPSDRDARRLYSEGLDRLRMLDALRARDLLQDAVAAEPKFALAHAALGSAWSTLGYDTKAAEEAKKAFELSAGLSREDRLWIEARYLAHSKDWDRAEKAYQQLVALAPDNLEYGLKLAAAQNWAGRPKDALATVEALRKLPPPVGDDPRIDQAEAAAAGLLTDLSRARAAAARAAEKATRRKARLLVASARIQEGWPLLYLGLLREAAAAFEEARRIYNDAGDWGGAAWASTYLGSIRFVEGNPAMAERMHRDAFAIFRQIGDRGGEATTLHMRAHARWRQGKLGESSRLYEQALAIYRETGAKSGIAMMLNNRAIVIHNQGDLSRANGMLEEVLAISRTSGNKLLAALGLYNLGDIALNRGELVGAQARFEEALAISQQIGSQREVAANLHGIANVLRAHGNLVEARKKEGECLAIFERIGQRIDVLESRLALAWLSIEEHDPGEAERTALEVGQEFEKLKDIDREAEARTALARSLLAQGRLSEARQAADRAAALSAKSESQPVRLLVAITVARVGAASGGAEAAARALKSLEAARAEASKAGRVGLEFESRLALGEIELLSDRSAAGRRRLEALEMEARARGFGLVARKAAVVSDGVVAPGSHQS
jgi:tetratricopeptide (TPR) repeat protein